jgi:hypothetical protein
MYWCMSCFGHLLIIGWYISRRLKNDFIIDFEWIIIEISYLRVVYHSSWMITQWYLPVTHFSFADVVVLIFRFLMYWSVFYQWWLVYLGRWRWSVVW